MKPTLGRVGRLDRPPALCAGQIIPKQVRTWPDCTEPVRKLDFGMEFQPAKTIRIGFWGHESEKCNCWLRCSEMENDLRQTSLFRDNETSLHRRLSGKNNDLCFAEGQVSINKMSQPINDIFSERRPAIVF
jgi:hypothetical protein